MLVGVTGSLELIIFTYKDLVLLACGARRHRESIRFVHLETQKESKHLPF